MIQIFAPHAENLSFFIGVFTQGRLAFRQGPLPPKLRHKGVFKSISTLFWTKAPEKCVHTGKRELSTKSFQSPILQFYAETLPWKKLITSAQTEAASEAYRAAAPRPVNEDLGKRSTDAKGIQTHNIIPASLMCFNRIADSVPEIPQKNVFSSAIKKTPGTMGSKSHGGVRGKDGRRNFSSKQAPPNMPTGVKKYLFYAAGFVIGVCDDCLDIVSDCACT